MPLITFQNALERCGTGSKSVLLGNGFSMAYSRDMFDYSSLFKWAEIDNNHPKLKEVFDQLGTRDFELVMKALKSASQIGAIYECNAVNIQQMNANIDELKELLIDAITQSHPNTVDTIPDSKYKSTRVFLNHFGKIFTTNYDLLLYWSLCRNIDGKILAGWRDGFSGENGHLSWDKGNDQNSYYLHGAMHLFMDSPDVDKIVYRTGNPLRDQVRTKILNDEFPIFVSEGTSIEKTIRIEENKYLTHCLDALKGLTGSLFIHGHSLDENDDHIWDAIAENRNITAIFVGIHGDENSARNIAKKAKASSIVERNQSHLVYYDVSTADIWKEAQN